MCALVDERQTNETIRLSGLEPPGVVTFVRFRALPERIKRPARSSSHTFEWSKSILQRPSNNALMIAPLRGQVGSHALHIGCDPERACSKSGPNSTNHRLYALSKMAAMPCPPPIHMVTNAYRPSIRSSS